MRWYRGTNHCRLVRERAQHQSFRHIHFPSQARAIGFPFRYALSAFPWNSSNSSANSSSSSFWLVCSKVRWQVTVLRNWRLFTSLDLCMSAVWMLIEHFSWFQDWAARYLRHPIRVTWFMVTLPGRNSCAALATCFRTRDSAPATSAVWTSRDGVKSMFQDVSVSSSLSFQFGAWATLWFFIFFNFFWQTCTT